MLFCGIKYIYFVQTITIVYLQSFLCSLAEMLYPLNSLFPLASGNNHSTLSLNLTTLGNSYKWNHRLLVLLWLAKLVLVMPFSIDYFHLQQGVAWSPRAGIQAWLYVLNTHPPRVEVPYCWSTFWICAGSFCIFRRDLLPLKLNLDNSPPLALFAPAFWPPRIRKAAMGLQWSGIAVLSMTAVWIKNYSEAD